MFAPLPLDPQDLLERYSSPAPEPRLRDARIGPYMTAGALWVAALVVIGPATPTGLIMLPVGAVLGAGAAEFFARVVHRHARDGWLRSQGTVRWTDVHARVIRDFRASIERSRAAALRGSQRATRQRQALDAARGEAERSVTFWTDAVEGEPESDSNRSQLRTAKELEEKLSRALRELDRKSERMTTFLDQCEAKADALEFSKRKLEESARLSSLADQAAGMLSDPVGPGEAAEHDFLKEAAAAFSSLGGLERFHLTVAAGDLPLESIEDVADQIVQSGEDEEKALQDLLTGLSVPDSGL